jgi:hypothetical protein
VRGDIAHVIAVIEAFQINRKLKLHVFHPPTAPSHNRTGQLIMSGNSTPNNHIFDVNKNFWTEFTGKTAQNRHFTPVLGMDDRCTQTQ